LLGVNLFENRVEDIVLLVTVGYFNLPDEASPGGGDWLSLKSQTDCSSQVAAA